MVTLIINKLFTRESIVLSFFTLFTIFFYILFSCSYLSKCFSLLHYIEVKALVLPFKINYNNIFKFFYKWGIIFLIFFKNNLNVFLIY